MALLTWDDAGEKVYETGTDRGVFYPMDTTGAYTGGVAWNGLTGVTESPSGAESNKHYADNIVYANILSAEEFGGTIEAFTWPEEFEQSDGIGSPTEGVSVAQQNRRPFGFAYRTKIGNDTVGQDFGYKLHLIYGATASPSEKAYATVSDSTEPITFSWEFSTTPVPVGTIDGTEYKPTSVLTIDSTKVDEAALETLEEILYGTAASDGEPPSTEVAAVLPPPADVIALFN